MTDMCNFEVTAALDDKSWGRRKYYCCIPHVTNRPIAKNGPNEIEV